MTWRAPRSASSERAISSSRQGQRIWIVTSAGMWLPSIRRRQKSNSICEAEGKPTCHEEQGGTQLGFFEHAFFRAAANRKLHRRRRSVGGGLVSAPARHTA